MEPIKRDLVVSLGTNCALTYNLRKLLGVERTGLLDWVITPLSCLPSLIRCRFALVDDDFGDALVRIEMLDKDSVVHAPTGIVLHHAFTRGRRGRLAKDWRSEIPEVAAKYRFLGERMDGWIKASERPAMFINGNGWHEAIAPEVSDRSGDPEMLLEVIRAVRDAYPHSDPLFCVTNGHPPSVERVRHIPGVRVATAENHGNWHEGHIGHYAGCETGWRNAFASIGFRPNPPKLEPRRRTVRPTRWLQLAFA